MTVERYAVDLVCCGLDDGTAILDTAADAHAFRETYMTGLGSHVVDRTIGHVRSLDR